MHGVLYVCLPRSEARTSLQAQKKVCDYLLEEGFATYLRFSGRCDYFVVGGRWSGRLSLLRLRHEQPKQCRTANGRIEWKKSEGMTLKQLQTVAAEREDGDE